MRDPLAKYFASRSLRIFLLSYLLGTLLIISVWKGVSYYNHYAYERNMARLNVGMECRDCTFEKIDFNFKIFHDHFKIFHDHLSIKKECP